MGRQRAGILVRPDVYVAIDRQLRATDSSGHAGSAGGPDVGRLVLVRGARGIGKSTLLTATGKAWRRDGLRVVEVGLAGKRDDLGLDGLVRAIRDQFEHVGDRRVLDATSRLATVANSLAADDGRAPEPLLRAIDAVAALSRALVAGGRATVLVDDADRAAGVTLTLRALARTGCFVVAAAADGPSAAVLARAADAVVEVPPLTPAGVANLLTRRYGRPADEGLLAALHASLGALAGHPATVMSTVEGLDRAGRLVRSGDRRRGHLCLTQDTRPIALPVDHPLVAQVRAGGAVAGRLSTAAATLRLRVDDLALLADATLGDIDDYGSELDRLVSAGVLVVEHGRIAPACTALGARLTDDYGPTAIARLHRACAAALLRRAGHGGHADHAMLADHVAAAGDTMPRDERTGTGLATVAGAALDRDPQRAVGWLRAALRHTAPGPSAGLILDQLLRLLVRTGRYAWLADTVAAVAGSGDIAPARRADLRIAAMLAAVHTGVPADPDSLRVSQAGQGDWGTLDLVRWWFDPTRPLQPTAVAQSTMEARSTAPVPTTMEARGGSASLLTPNEVAIARLALRLPADQEAAAPSCVSDDVLLAGSLGDLVAVLERVLGARYAAPEYGPLAAYHRLVSAFQRGDGATVLSCGRELELVQPGGTLVHALARLLTAEVLSLRGDARLAWQQMQSVPPCPPLLGLRWWVTAGASTVEKHGSELRRGVQALRSAPGGGLGVEMTLARMAELAAWADPAHGPRLLEQAVAAVGSGGFGVTEGLRMLVAAVLAADPESAAASAELARAAGDRMRLVSACLVAAGVSGPAGGDQSYWLRQAHDAARGLAAPARLARVGALLRARGLRPSRRRTDRPTFSAAETEIIELVRGGWTNRQIAVRVRMSEKTVESYLSRLYSRTGCRSRVELATIRLPHGGHE